MGFGNKQDPGCRAGPSRDLWADSKALLQAPCQHLPTEQLCAQRGALPGDGDAGSAHGNAGLCDAARMAAAPGDNRHCFGILSEQYVTLRSQRSEKNSKISCWAIQVYEIHTAVNRHKPARRKLSKQNH